MTDIDAVFSQFRWGGHPFPGDSLTVWTLGPLVVWGRSANDELWLTHVHRDDYHVKTFSPGGDAPRVNDNIPEAPDFTAKEWARWVLKEKPGQLEFQPVFPDLPIVVKPEYPFRVTPNAMARIFVRVPVWLRIRAADQDITDIPSAVLSNTWFGDPTEGELCYWISSSARRVAAADAMRPYQAICPILIVNAAAEELSVEKICLRVPSLTMFEHNGQLWSDETTVRYRGHNAGSEIRPSGQAPEQAAGADRISQPRVPIQRGLAAHTFATLKEIKGLGLFND